MIGTTISHYRILEKLGEGGMGIVYKAQDTRLERLVALKFLPLDLSDAHDAKQRFITEARAASALNHPNVMTVFGAGQHEGAPYLVSELLDGRTLRQELGTGALSTRKVTDYALQVAQGHATGGSCFTHPVAN